MSEKEMIDKYVSGVSHDFEITEVRVDEAIKPLGCFALVLAIIVVVSLIWGLS